MDYPSSTDIRLKYDGVNRLTNMVDAAGTSAYTYSSAGNLLTEDGPWSSDTVTHTYDSSVPHLRKPLIISLQQPTGSWTNGFIYDAARRLTNVTSQAGAFNYAYHPGVGSGTSASSLIKKLLEPSGAYITNTFDTVARLTGTYLKNSSNLTNNSHVYVYDPAHQRTNETRKDGSSLAFKYDNIGQLKVADSSVNSEDRGYLYDAAWNLNKRTNNGAAFTFAVDSKNQLTSDPDCTDAYDGNGNLTNRTSINAPPIDYSYDDENQLTSVQQGSWRTEFVYDGFGRLRKRPEYTWNGFSWSLSTTTYYVYDGMRVIQERTTSPTVSYTRGVDLSGTLQGAGGIGGLLARSHAYQSGSGGWTNHNVYHADGGGNITYMLNSSQSVVASYRYDPFGNTISSSGSLASANVYRFSGKEIHVNSGLYYYGFRFYDPNLQRWVNRDPIAEDSFWHSRRRTSGVRDNSRSARFAGSNNLYEFAKNAPPVWVDRSGLDIWVGHRPFGLFGWLEHWNINVGNPNPNGSYTSYSFQGRWGNWFGEIYKDKPPTSFDQGRYLYTTPEQDAAAKSILEQMVGDSMHYSLLNNTCHEFSCEMFDFFKDTFPDAEFYSDLPPCPPFDSRGWRGGDL